MEVEVGGQDSDDKSDKLIKPSDVKISGQFIPFQKGNDTVTQLTTRDINSENTVADENNDNVEPKYPEGKLCGYLTIMARGIIKTNRQRWFVYGDKTCKLYYYRNQNDMVPLGEIDISRATFHFDPANVDKPGTFQIRSDNREHVLDASNRHAMMYWLQELQKRRRLYNSNQSTKLTRPISTITKRPQRLSGLDVLKPQDQNGSKRESTDGGLSPGKSSIPEIVVPSFSPLTVSTGDTLKRSHTGSFSSLKSDLRDALGSIMSGQSLTGKLGGGKASKPSPSPSSSSTTSEDWTLLENSEQGKSQKVPNPPQNKIITAFNKIKVGKKGNCTTSPTDTQVCHRCKELQTQLNMTKDEHHSAEDELQAHREIVRLLQKELDKLSRDLSSRNEADAQDREGVLQMVEERDKHITELQYSIVNLKQEKEVLSQKFRSVDGETEELKEQVTMYQEMLKAKDDTIMQLTNEITALEKEVNNNRTSTQNNESVNTENKRQTVIVVSNTQELEKLKDMCQGYELQNKFLTKEILELNYLRQNDQANEKALYMSNAKLEAQYFQTRSKYLYLLQEMQKPKLGDSSNKQQEDAVSQLLDDAMASENDDSENIEIHLTSSGQEYDRYGFIKKYGVDEEEIDPLTVRAEQLERHSEEINNRLKDEGEIQSLKLKWENYMVGLGVKTLVRSTELKTLIRMGIPHEYREQIWKGCIDFYVGEVRDKLGPHYYKELANKSKNTSLNPETKQIELDLLRTLPNNKHYESIEHEGIDKLRKVLLSYSWHNPVIGYCQGLNRLAAISLLFLPEEESFWCLVAIVDFLMPRDYYSKTLLGAQVDQRVLKDLLHEKLPRVYAHFDQLEIDMSLFTFNWFLTIFIDNIPTTTFLRIWDSFLYEGSKVLFRFAVAFFKNVEEDILKQTTALQLNHFMRVMGEKMNNPKQICQLAFNWINPFPMRLISTRRQYHLQHVRLELAELDRMREGIKDTQDRHGNHGDTSDDEQ